MAVTVKKITLWRNDVQNKPGILATALEPLARAGVDLQALMAYRYPADRRKAAIELYPITGKKATTAAREGGLKPADIPALLVTGDNKAGLGYAISKSVADAGINLSFALAQVIGRKFSAIYGFEKEADARKASSLIKKAAAGRKR